MMQCNGLSWEGQGDRGRSTLLKLASASILALAVFGQVNAEESGADTFKIALGGYALTRYESSISLTEANSGLGVSISPEETLGVTREQAVFRLDGHYRFNDRHSLSFSWYRIGSQGNRSIQKEIEWVDDNGDPIVIPIGASVETSLDYDIYKLGYLWSFYNSEKVELGVGAGLHFTRIAIGLTAETTSTGVDARRVSTSVPLPVLSFAVGYHVTPKLKWYLKSEFFALAFKDWDGLFTDTALGIEYSVMKNLALGLGIGGNALRVTEETDDYSFKFDNRISGALFYVAARF
jgi:hypothetical protein